jgi:AcrR family transcriptional regulator
MATDDGTRTRREELFAAAAEIFWEKGYHATSMGDLAAAMQMGQSSLYHHIDSKETLLYEMSESSMRNITEAAASATSTDPEERLRDVISLHVGSLLHDRSRHATALIELRSLKPEQRKAMVDLRTNYDQLIDDTVSAVQTSTGRWPGVPTRLVRLALLGMLNWTVFWYSEGGAESPASVAEAFSSIFLPPLPAA